MPYLRHFTGVCLLCLAYVFPSFGQDGSSFVQTYTNEPLLEVLNEWNERYGIDFVYNPNDLSEVSINQAIKAGGLAEALSQLLQGSSIIFELSSSNRVLLRLNPTLRQPHQLINLSGRVTDKETGQHLSYATLFVPGSRFGTTAKEDGSFSLSIPDTLSTQQLVCRYLGYKALAFSLSRKHGFMDIAMTQDEHVLDAIKIEDVGNSFISSMNLGTYAFQPQLAPTLPALSGQDPLKVIQYLPGVSARTENLSQLSVRGGQRDENLFMLDDIPLFHVDHYLGIFSVFHPNAVNGFQFYQTDFPVQYGGRISSILAVEGNSGLQKKPQISLSQDLFSSNLSLSTPISNKVGLFLAARRGTSELGDEFSSQLSEAEAINQITADNLSDNAEANIPNVPIPKFGFYDLYGRLDIQPARKSLISVSFFQSMDRIDFRGDANANGERPKQYFHGPRRKDTLVNARPAKELIISSHESYWTNQGGSFSIQKGWGRNSFSRTYGFLSRYGRGFEFKTFEKGDPFYMKFGDVNQLQFAGIGQHFQFAEGLNKLELGVALKRLDVNYELSLERSELNNSRIFQQTPRTAVIEAYGSYTFWLGTRLKIKTAFRETYLQNRREWLHSPRLSATYLLSERLSFKAAYGQYNQYIREISQFSPYATSDAFWALADNGPIGISSARHYSVGASLKSPILSLHLEAYYKQLSGLINKSIVAQLDENGNSRIRPRFFEGEGFSTGLDATLQLSLKKYEGWLSYSLGLVEHQFDELNFGQSFRPQEDQRHQFKWAHSLQLNNWNLSLTYVYGTGRRYLEWTGGMTQALLRGELANQRLEWERLPDYHRLDAGLSYDFKLGKVPTSLGFSVYNAFDHRNVAFKQYVFSLGDVSSVAGLRKTTVAGSEVPLLGITPNISLKVRL